MTAADDLVAEPEERITLDQLKHRAEAVRDLATTEVKEVAAEIAEAEVTKTLLIVAGVVIVAASLAFYLGTRAGSRRYVPPPV